MTIVIAHHSVPICVWSRDNDVCRTGLPMFAAFLGHCARTPGLARCPWGLLKDSIPSDQSLFDLSVSSQVRNLNASGLSYEVGLA